MSGELILENNGWKQVLPALLLSCLVAGGITAVMLSIVHLEGMALAVTAALVTYVLFRLTYPEAMKLVSGKRAGQPIIWTMTGSDLVVGERTIPLREIKNVHCWPNRDALGHSSPGWTVNIETTGKNLLLRSLKDGEQAETSALRLRALVMALGYEDKWPL